jgi:hypothetical protein
LMAPQLDLVFCQRCLFAGSELLLLVLLSYLLVTAQPSLWQPLMALAPSKLQGEQQRMTLLCVAVLTVM